MAGFPSLRLLLLFSLITSPAFADDWPLWLGPQQDSIWREEGVSMEFPAEGPKTVWRAEVGSGYAGPSVANGNVYVMDRVLDEGASLPGNPFDRSPVEGKERLLCFDDATGDLKWKHEYDCTYRISYALGPRVTPQISDGKVYIQGAEGDLKCLNAESGDVVWSHNYGKDYNAETPMWGFAAHPLIDGDQLICLVGGEGSAVVSFNKETGEELWRSMTVESLGYCPPTIQEAGGTRQLIIWHGTAACGLNPENGEQFWEVPLKADYSMTIAVPRRYEDKLFFMPYQQNSMLLKMLPDHPNVEVAWRASGRKSLHGTNASPFIRDGYIYGCDAKGRFRCVELETGKWIWETLAPTTGDRPQKWGTAFLVLHEPTGKYVLFNEHGELITASLSPKGYEEISRAKILEATGEAGGRNVLWSHPAFANGCVYARNDGALTKVKLTE
ncbi:outer membrane protein assembly factor BamB family protein [Calycomorphotria hydatis]|uniref:Outer membrane biogenesis protein BamB n=1 Tax=Calycomorphotria hydatis TaxID=2528027 RepID=A0A517T4T9_9PLAN|nr:PQQ-binding-like beta-propeller repeat protein [Calycomorphotria hydatis]QDT63396.1 outer membrane biogenesis protein BamB [Calycomorphotria hydatis]